MEFRNVPTDESQYQPVARFVAPATELMETMSIVLHQNSSEMTYLVVYFDPDAEQHGFLRANTWLPRNCRHECRFCGPLVIVKSRDTFSPIRLEGLDVEQADLQKARNYLCTGKI